MNDKLTIFHTGFQIIEEPDIHYGRVNADFGQGFYLSDDQEFSRRWAKNRVNSKTYLNRYEIDFSNLKIKHFDRNEEWFDYIFKNRTGHIDDLCEYDVIIGPIANDTIYNVWGIPTSGMVSRDQALQLLLIGPVYEQIVIKSEKAAQALKFCGAEEISKEQIQSYAGIVKAEEERFQEEFAVLLDALL